MEKDVLKYIKNYDFNSLMLFIDGFLIKKKLAKISLSKEEKSFYKEFSHWIFNYYNESSNNRGGWDSLILFRNKGSHQDAIKEFFVFYRKWYLEFDKGLDL